jgi:hypothetical protein
MASVSLLIHYRAFAGSISVGENHLYFADFYLPDRDVYYDPKSQYHHKLQGDKIGRVRAQNPHIKLVVLGESLLRELGLIK